MSLDREQVCLLRQTVKVALNFLDGDEKHIKQALLMYASSTGEEKFVVSKKSLDQVASITELLSAPYKIIGAAISHINGSFAGRRKLELEDHDEAVAVLQEEIKNFVASNQAIPAAAPEEEISYQPFPIPDSPPDETLPIVRLYLQAPTDLLHLGAALFGAENNDEANIDGSNYP